MLISNGHTRFKTCYMDPWGQIHGFEVTLIGLPQCMVAMLIWYSLEHSNYARLISWGENIDVDNRTIPLRATVQVTAICLLKKF